jgi:hypothetical protein
VGAGGPVVEAEAEAESKADELQLNESQIADSQEGPNSCEYKAPCHQGVGAVVVGPGGPVVGTEAEAIAGGAVLVADEPGLNEGIQILGPQEGLNDYKDEVPCHLSVGAVAVGIDGAVVGAVAGVAGAFLVPGKHEPNVGQIRDWGEQNEYLYSAHLELRDVEA